MLQQLVFKEPELIDKVETNQAVKNRKFLLITSAVSVIIAVIKLFTDQGMNNYRGIGWWVDYVFFFIGPAYVLFDLGRKKKNTKRQFIEWYTDKIIYHSGKEERIIAKQDIKLIDIKLDLITIKTVDGNNYDIGLFDYKDYDVRKRIKKNFEEYNALT